MPVWYNISRINIGKNVLKFLYKNTVSEGDFQGFCKFPRELCCNIQDTSTNYKYNWPQCRN